MDVTIAPELKGKLFEYALRLGDNPLILGQRLGEWCGHGPQLELDIALTNIALDHVGQARFFLTFAAELEAAGRDEDDLAFLRDVTAFRNILLVEQPNGDWGQTLVRQYFFSVYYRLFLEALQQSRLSSFQAIAEKSLKEVSYHCRFSKDWLVRLGDGTAESHQRVQDGVERHWRFVGEMFDMDEVDTILHAEGIGVDATALQENWLAEVDGALLAATLSRPDAIGRIGGGKQGRHTEHLGHVLSEMQFLQRAYPGAEW